jgi:uncharacterized membrane protein YjjP (DUF1212 family)
VDRGWSLEIYPGVDRSTQPSQPIMSTEKIEPDYDAVPFPSDSSRSRPSLHDVYKSFQRNPASASYPVFHTPVYNDPAGSSWGARRAASPHTLVTPRPVVASHYPGPQQHAARLTTIDSVGFLEAGLQGRYIPWNDDRRDHLDEGSENLAHSKDPIQEEKDRLTAADVEYERLEAMDTKEREKYLKKKRIEFHVTCGYLQANVSTPVLIHELFVAIYNRHNFLLRLARALLTFGAPSHRIESQLQDCAQILDVKAEFVHIPSLIICSFYDPEFEGPNTQLVQVNGALDLGILHQIHLIYRDVVHDEISAKVGTTLLNELLVSKPIYGPYALMTFSFLMSFLICPLAFGGSLLDTSVAGVGAIIVSFMKFRVATKSEVYGHVFE